MTTKITPEIFGYFSDTSKTPAFDPGFSVPCPICLRPIEPGTVKTISLMLPGDSRSFFYRAHRNCYDTAGQEAVSEIESALIDHRAERQHDKA